MSTGSEPRLSWRVRRPGTTGLLLVAFLAVLVLWIQVRPHPDPAPSTVTVVVPATAPGVLTPTVTVRP